MGTGNSAIWSLAPGRNPTGNTTVPLVDNPPQIGSTSGTNPVLPTNNLPSGAPATNTYDPTSVVPTFGANSGPYSPTSLTTSPTASAGGTSGTPISAGGVGGAMAGMTQKGYNDFLHELDKTFGEGTGSMIASFLNSGAGFNQDAINNLFAALQPGYNRAQQQMVDQFSTSGNRFGSGAQIGLADLQSQQLLNEGQIETQVYEQSVSDYLNTLLNVGDTNAKSKASSPSLIDQIGSFLGIGGSAASGASSIISAIAPNADTGILDTIASAAAGLA